LSAATPEFLPELLVVVDTEEEFDWTRPFARENRATRSIAAQGRAQSLFDRFGLVPTYVVDYPVAANPAAARTLRAFQDSGRAEIGAHLHTWVTPPHREEVTTRNSYQCNLPPELKHAKIEALTETVEAAFGRAPTIFKAGRHGLGPLSARHLVKLGYQIDCSILPHHDLRGDGGPDFTAACDRPHWYPGVPDLLEVPVTAGFFGRAPWIGRAAPHLFDNPRAVSLHLPGLLARSGLVSRSRLTPEGVSAAEQCRLLDALIARGQRTFSLVYHSPSLAPGNTPYVRTEAELARFLATIEQVLTYFRDSLGGRFTTLTQVHARMSAERTATGWATSDKRRAAGPPPIPPRPSVIASPGLDPGRSNPSPPPKMDCFVPRHSPGSSQ